MTVRYIVRPSGFMSTPKRIRRTVGAQGIRKHTANNVLFDYNQDLFLGYPHPMKLNRWTRPDYYSDLYNYFIGTKYQQRETLHNAGVKVPQTIGIDISPYQLSADAQLVLRPFRHTQGQDYTVTDINTLSMGDLRNHYASLIFPKRWEYRCVYMGGELLFTLFKKNQRQVEYTRPWNLSNGFFFMTVHQLENNRVRHTSFFDDVQQWDLLDKYHLIAFDIMIDEHFNYAVCETNFCPALTINNNLERIRDYVQSL